MAEQRKRDTPKSWNDATIRRMVGIADGVPSRALVTLIRAGARRRDRLLAVFLEAKARDRGEG